MGFVTANEKKKRFAGKKRESKMYKKLGKNTDNEGCIKRVRKRVSRSFIKKRSSFLASFSLKDS